MCGVQGWNWVDEGRNGRHKYGYVTEEADHDITFVVRHDFIAQSVMCMEEFAFQLHDFQSDVQCCNDNHREHQLLTHQAHDSFLGKDCPVHSIAMRQSMFVMLQVNTAGCPDPSTLVTLGIGHLKSYERMGQALVSCVSGCTCNPTAFDGHNPASPASQEFWAYVAVTQSEQCVFEVASLTATKSGQNKVKVTSLLLTCMNPEQALEVPIAVRPQPQPAAT